MRQFARWAARILIPVPTFEDRNALLRVIRQINRIAPTRFDLKMCASRIVILLQYSSLLHYVPLIPLGPVILLLC